jgi:RNA recognition motif-containing protein
MSLYMCVIYFQQQERDVTNLYIANLPVHMTENDLQNMFASFGQVISTRVLRDPHGISRCVGFARMETKEQCESIIQAFNGKFLPRNKLYFIVVQTVYFFKKLLRFLMY